MPKFYHFRSAADFLAAFKTHTSSRLPLTPLDIPDGLSLGATSRLSPTALAGSPVNLWRPSEWLEYRTYALTTYSIRLQGSAEALARDKLKTTLARLRKK